jgi:hypothetical protein
MTGPKDTTVLPIRQMESTMPISFKRKTDNTPINNGNDRLFDLKPMPGKEALSSTGIVDTRLFNGKNRLHAIHDEQTALWSLKQEAGSVPPSLQQRWTSYSALLKHIKSYYATRHVDVFEVYAQPTTS